MSVLKSEVTEYIVYDPDSIDVLFDGEWTKILNGGTLGLHAGPASTKCLSASPRPPSSARDAVLSSLPCPRGAVRGGSLSSAPCKTHSSAPLVTKLEKRLSCLPPKRLRRKLGNHSPVVWGTSGAGAGSSSWRVGDPLGVMDDPDGSWRLRTRS